MRTRLPRSNLQWAFDMPPVRERFNVPIRYVIDNKGLRAYIQIAELSRSPRVKTSGSRLESGLPKSTAWRLSNGLSQRSRIGTRSSGSTTARSAKILRWRSPSKIKLFLNVCNGERRSMMSCCHLFHEPLRRILCGADVMRVAVDKGQAHASLDQQKHLARQPVGFAYSRGRQLFG